MNLLIKGAGDLASGIAWRLYQAGYRNILMTEIAVPTTVRRTVAFSRAVYEGRALVEKVPARLIEDQTEIDAVWASGEIALIADETMKCLSWYQADILIDATIAKRDTGTRIDDADLVIGVGPGFTTGENCDLAVETKRGHYLGRLIHNGSPVPDTGIPGNIGGYTKERIIRAGADGTWAGLRKIGDLVKKGDPLGKVIDPATGEETVTNANIDGVVRGMLQDGVSVFKGMKSGDVDPRGEVSYCQTISDKALAIAGGVLEAVSAYAQR